MHMEFGHVRKLHLAQGCRTDVKKIIGNEKLQLELDRTRIPAT